MSFSSIHRKITAKLQRRRDQADSIFNDNANLLLTPWRLRFLSESLLSNIWIDWNDFVKNVFIHSCNGTVTLSGNIVTPRVATDNCPDRICYEVKQLAAGQNVHPTKIYTGRQDPTWANPDKIISCITGLAPTNTATLLNAFGSGNLVGPKRIHVVRNACAHKSRPNRIDVLALKSNYQTTHFHDPIDIIWGTNSATSSIAIYEWITDLETMADLATN